MNSREVKTYMYVVSMGALYCMTRDEFTAYLRLTLAGEEPNPGRHGFLVGVPINVTDMTPEEARGILERSGYRV